MSELLTTSEVAVLLRMPKSTVTNLARKGEIPGKKIGRQWRFHRARINHIIDPEINGVHDSVEDINEFVG